MIRKFAVEPGGIDAELLEQAVGDRTVGVGAVDQQGPAIQELKPAAQVELVAFGMPTEIIVVFKNENARRASCFFSKEMCRRQAANAFPDDYEIVGTRRSAQIQIGNAVPPLLAERLATSLAASARGRAPTALTA